MFIKDSNKIYEPTVRNKGSRFEVELEAGKTISGIKKIDANYFKLAGKQFFRAEDDKYVYVSNGKDYYKFLKIDEDEQDFIASPEELGIQEVISPMPGSVVKVLVKTGDIVGEGDPLIIIEAMKMETSLYAALAGEVSDLNVEDGEQIDSDRVLMKVLKV